MHRVALERHVVLLPLARKGGAKALQIAVSAFSRPLVPCTLSAQLTRFTPASPCLQVLRYGLGQYYHRHTDSLENDSPRMATLLIYLSDPIEGGETAFPLAKQWADPLMPKLFGPFSECVKVRPGAQGVAAGAGGHRGPTAQTGPTPPVHHTQPRERRCSRATNALPRRAAGSHAHPNCLQPHTTTNRHQPPTAVLPYCRTAQCGVQAPPR